MRKAESYLEQLTEELGAEQSRLVQRLDRIDDITGRLDDLTDGIRSRTTAGVNDALDAAAVLRGSVERARGEFVEQWGERVDRWVDISRELRQATGCENSLAELGELSASVAHEIRNPLCGMLLSLEVLQTKMDPDDSRTVLLRNVRREAERMESVVENLLQFARPYKPRPNRCPLDDLVERSVESVKCHLADAQMEVVIRCQTPDSRAEVDPLLVQQVFANILLNAIGASPKGSRLHVTIGAPGAPGHLTVAFRDEGTGIDDDHLERIFEPFYTSKRSGTGLGLSVCRKIVDAHHGRIDVDSTVGEGTTFAVSFPASVESSRLAVAA